MKTSETKSTLISQTRGYVDKGHRIEIAYLETGKRSTKVTVTEDILAQIPPSHIIAQEPVPPVTFDEPAPPETCEPAMEEAHAQAWAKYHAAKERFTLEHAEDKAQRAVDIWVPIKVVHHATFDGYPLRVFHTLRGPILGAVLHEDSHCAQLYSPCLIDPNIERGRVHYFPLAFAGYALTLYKTGIGESVPQEAEIQGYPSFVERNRLGDYAFRLKAAYHHIEADYPDDAQLISVDASPRDLLMGLLATSDTREERMLERARQAQAFHDQQKK